MSVRATNFARRVQHIAAVLAKTDDAQTIASGPIAAEK
jgi:hypothetical protein